jgi:hypothetical protein
MINKNSQKILKISQTFLTYLTNHEQKNYIITKNSILQLIQDTIIISGIFTNNWNIYEYYRNLVQWSNNTTNINIFLLFNQSNFITKNTVHIYNILSTYKSFYQPFSENSD